SLGIRSLPPCIEPRAQPYDGTGTALAPALLHDQPHRLSATFRRRRRHRGLRRPGAAQPQAAPCAARAAHGPTGPPMMPLAKLGGALGIAVVGVITGFGVTRPAAPGTAQDPVLSRPGAATHSGVLAQLGLDDEQRAKIAELRSH